MKCEIQANVWLTFNLKEEDIVNYNRSHGVPENLLNNFNLAMLNGFNPFDYSNWEFSESSVNDIQNNQTGNYWCEFDNDNHKSPLAKIVGEYNAK